MLMSMQVCPEHGVEVKAANDEAKKEYEDKL